MICTSIKDKSFEEIMEILDHCEMAEIRLDSCNLTRREIEECFSSDVPLIATCRLQDLISRTPALQSFTGQSLEVKAAQMAESRLVAAIEAGANYVDVELGAPKQMSKRLRSVAHENGALFIRSVHDFDGTPSAENLISLVEKCRYHGADIVKIVTTAHSKEDVEKVMNLYSIMHRPGTLVAFCMGECGRMSRIDCLKMGAPFTYAAYKKGEETASGQWQYEDMCEDIYKGFSFVNPESPIIMPCSKSFAQRAVVLAALAEGESYLSGYTHCGDNQSAINLARALGADVRVDGETLIIKGIGGNALDVEELFVGESGLLTRLMIPLVAQLSDKAVTIKGEKTLCHRPLTGAREIMEAYGVELVCEDVDCKVPVTVKGKLSGGKVRISGKNGSQLISGLLMALPFADKNSVLEVSDPKSIPYMFITLEVLKKFGVKVVNEMFGGRDFFEQEGDWALCTDMIFKQKGGQRPRAAKLKIEKDWSAAANFLVAGAIYGRVEIEGLDTTSLQADLSIMDVLMDAGASLSQMDGKDGLISVQRAPLTSFRVDASNCPDLFPILAVLSVFCQGESEISGVGRLANKETDRASAILDMLSKMGVEARISDDTLFVKGESLASRILNDRLPKGGEYRSYSDHRMAMALKIASLSSKEEFLIDDEACVDKSFPDFFKCEIFS